jgi:hypothetical protein
MDLQQLLGRAGAGGAGGAEAGVDQPVADTSEQIHISSLALLKMLKHGKCSDSQLQNTSLKILIFLFR